jgi:hypothetical protein
MAGTEDDGDVIGVLTPSWADAGVDTDDASATASIPSAAIFAVRLTLLGFFTIVLWCEFSLYLLVELENSGLRMPGQPFPGNFEALADNGDGSRGFDLILVGHESRRIGAEDVVAKMDDGAAAQVRADHVISVECQDR